MADDTQPTDTPKEEIPAFRISPKKVDDSWKEEIRREREAAAKAAAAKMAPPPPSPAAPATDASAAEAPQAAAGLDGDVESEGDMPSAPPQPAATPLNKAEQQQSKIFMTFLGGLAQQALMQMGEIESPFSGQREVDIQGARYTVELLNVIQIKTRNNLTADESAAIDEAIQDLKARYVEVAREVQRQMAAQAQKAGVPGMPGMRPGPGGTIPRR